MKYNNQHKKPRPPYVTIILTVILASYFFSGINLILAGCFASSEYSSYLFIVGALLLVMTLVSVFDDRKEMRTRFYAIVCSTMHLGFCVALSILFSFWWIVVYICEAIFGAVVTIVVKKYFD